MTLVTSRVFGRGPGFRESTFMTLLMSALLIWIGSVIATRQLSEELFNRGAPVNSPGRVCFRLNLTRRRTVFMSSVHLENRIYCMRLRRSLEVGLTVSLPLVLIFIHCRRDGLLSTISAARRSAHNTLVNSHNKFQRDQRRAIRRGCERFHILAICHILSSGQRHIQHGHSGLFERELHRTQSAN